MEGFTRLVQQVESGHISLLSLQQLAGNLVQLLFVSLLEEREEEEEKEEKEGIEERGRGRGEGREERRRGVYSSGTGLGERLACLSEGQVSSLIHSSLPHCTAATFSCLPEFLFG